MAKAPVPGLAKTRLAAGVGELGAARLAAASLLDTLATSGAVFPPGRRVLALDGHLADACDREDLVEATVGWVVVPQRGRTFADRLVDAHVQAHRIVGGPVVQVGMDTPHLDAEVLQQLPGVAQDHGGPVLGPAEDGGWWVLVTTHALQAAVLSGVPMSRSDTGRLTEAALVAAGYPPASTVVMRDVDVREDAAAVAELAPWTRFATLWRALAGPDREGVINGGSTVTGRGSS